MNADAIKELVKVIRLDWKKMGNPFRYVFTALNAPRSPENLRSLLQLSAVEENFGQLFSSNTLNDLVVAYDAWLDLWPDSWDGDLFPEVLEDFIPFSQDVIKLLAIGKISTALEVSNLVRGQTPNSWDESRSLTPGERGRCNFHNLVEDLKAEHEQAIEDLDNLQAKEMYHGR